MSSEKFVLEARAYNLREIKDISIGGATWKPTEFKRLRKYLLDHLAKQTRQMLMVTVYSKSCINGETFTGYLTASRHDKRTIEGEVQYYRGIENPMQTAIISISPTKGKMVVRFSNISK